MTIVWIYLLSIPVTVAVRIWAGYRWAKKHPWPMHEWPEFVDRNP